MSKKILIVEDDEQISHVYDINFKKLGYESNIEINGEDGFKKAKEDKPDLILLDLMLQGRDGFWFLEQVKGDSDLKKVPVIVMSNLGQEDDKERALGLGAKQYLVKADYSIQEVMDVIKGELSK